MVVKESNLFLVMHIFIFRAREIVLGKGERGKGNVERLTFKVERGCGQRGTLKVES